MNEEQQNSSPVKSVSREAAIKAMAGVNSRQPQLSCEPPSNDELKLFYANKLSPERCEPIFEYIARHPESYERWVSRASAKPVLVNWWSWLNDLCDNLFRNAVSLGKSANSQRLLAGRPVLTGVGFSGLIASLAILLFFSYPDFTGKQQLRSRIQDSYIAVHGLIAVDASSTDSGLAALPWQEKAAAFGFGPAETASPEQQAFSIGLIRGVTALLPSQDKREAITIQPGAKLQGQEHYADLALWNILLWAVAQNKQTMSAEFWDKQLEISALIREVFSAQTGQHQYIRTHIDSVIALINEAKSGEKLMRTYRDLERELYSSRVRLAASSEPSL